ncbi:MAG: VanZ family protein [Clostridia bacterium]|nr:VanZ family protein [Clostridia bacterium]
MVRKILKWALTAAVVGWCIFIWQFSFAPAAKSAETSSAVQDICNEVLESLGSDKQVSSHTVRKTAHFTEFFVLGMLAVAALAAHGFRHALLLSPLVFVPAAIVDECIQLFTPNRGPSVLDVLLDSLGGICGACLFFALFSLVLYIYNKRREKISKTT